MGNKTTNKTIAFEKFQFPSTQRHEESRLRNSHREEMLIKSRRQKRQRNGNRNRNDKHTAWNCKLLHLQNMLLHLQNIMFGNLVEQSHSRLPKKKQRKDDHFVVCMCVCVYVCVYVCV